MHDSTIRRYGSSARLLVLDIVEHDGASDARQITAGWQARRPSTPDVTAERLPRVVDQLLWQLERLGWIQRQEDGLALTDLGRRALAISPRGSGVQ